MKKRPEPKISGTLEIGAGSDPYADTTVAVDESMPLRPKKIPKGVGPIRVTISESASDNFHPPNNLSKKLKSFWQLKLDNSSRLRLYWIGDAADLPDEWNGKFSEVKSRNALMALEQSEFKEPYAVLKKGGKIYVLANGPGSMVGEGTQSNHVRHVVSLLRKAGFVDIEVHEFANRWGDTSFEARKPLRVAKRKRKHITRRAPVGLRSMRSGAK